jgi:signal transduction histidine kinase
MKMVLSIRAKLFALALSTTLLALTLAGGALSVFEVRSHRQTLTRELQSTAEIIGQNLSATLIFERADSAQRVLSALSSRADVVSACLYDGKGSPFADYRRAGERGACPPRAGASEPGIRSDRLVVHHPVRVEGQPPGSLRLEATLTELQRRIRVFALVLLLVLSGAALAAVLLTARLQRLISAPVLELADTAQRVSHSHDYTLRVPERGQDEVGVALQAFNHMLERIEAEVLERRKAEQQLIALNATLEERVAERTAMAESRAAELKRSNEELERFAAVTSHDLQEPLRAVSSYAQLVQRRLTGKLDAETEIYFEHVLAGVRRMKNLIGDLLNYARVGRQALARVPVSLDAVVDLALADLATAVADSGAEITREPLPEVLGDQTRLAQVMRNLLTNAISYRGPEPPRIHISAQSMGADGWRIAVKDNGIGIDPRYSERVFQMFQRLHGAERPGTGIGLTICRKIVELHGGRIWVESAPGQGATFYFTLPAATLAPER